MYTQPGAAAKQTEKPGSKTTACWIANACCSSTGHNTDKTCSEYQGSSLTGSWYSKHRLSSEEKLPISVHATAGTDMGGAPGLLPGPGPWEG